MPSHLKELAQSWDDLTISPYSHSFYSSSRKRWNFTPEGCLRLSTHWNFKTKKQRQTKEVSCRTNVQVTNGSYWTLAQYKSGTWVVTESVKIR